jgi:hypothetical protein
MLCEVNPNLTLHKRSCASAWIFDLEFLQQYFWTSQAHRKQDIRYPVIFYI